MDYIQLWTIVINLYRVGLLLQSIVHQFFDY